MKGQDWAAWLAALGLVLSAAAPQAQSNRQLTINSAHPNLQAQELTITGGQFGALAPIVTLNGDDLLLVSHSSDMIVAILPPEVVTTPGSYQLIVARRAANGRQDGPQGAASFEVAIGDDASTGPEGPAGPEGPVGPQGPAGPEGPSGPEGPVGPVGPSGPEGPAGPMGLVGPVGPQGETGATGPIGPQGVAGPNGATGPQGPAGATGPIGPIGPTGPQGPAAPSVVPEFVASTNTFAMAPGVTRIQDLTCPATKMAIGGGFELSAGAADAKVIASRPYTSSTWRVVFTGTGTSIVTISVWAICIEP